MTGPQYAVSAGHPRVAAIMAEVLADGGNAVDAGVAGSIASTVYLPDQCNVGGIVPMTISTAHDEVWAVGGVGRWSSSVTLDAVLARYGGDLPAGSPRAIVPAAVAAWVAALARFGTRSFAELAAPSIQAARAGITVTAALSRSLTTMGERFSVWDENLRIYWPAGRPPWPGEVLVQPELADLLSTLSEAERGADRGRALRGVHDAFYRGRAAEVLTRFVQDQGGWMEKADFAAFEASIDPALNVRIGDATIWAPPGYTQGPVALVALRILERLRELGSGDDWPHLVIEALHAAFWHRERWCADPDFVDTASHLDGTVIDRLATSVGDRLASVAFDTGPSTTSVCAVDADGMIFSGTPSDTLDAAPVAPGLGIMCSPRGGQSRLDPQHPNRIEAGKRPVVTPAPLVVFRESTGERLAIASAGGDMIVQSLVQTLDAYLARGFEIQQAVAAPRIGVFTFPDAFHPNEQIDVVRVERQMSSSVIANLREHEHRLESWSVLDFDAGAVTVAGLRPTAAGTEMIAVADVRRECAARIG